MPLKIVLLSLISEHQYGIRDSTKSFLKACIQCFEAYLGREATSDDLNRELVNKYIDWMTNHRASATVRSQRCGLLMLWRFAADQNICEWPRRIRAPRKVEPIVTTWTLQEVQQLRDHCLSLPGLMPNGIHRSIYFASIVSCGYETGFRLSDQLSIEYQWIRRFKGEGHLTIVEAKTGKQSRRVITRDTMDMIDKSMEQSPGRKLVWPLWARKEAFFDQFRKIVQRSGIRPGTFKFLRRTACTNVEQQAKGLGTEFLNHSSPVITKESYIDRHQTHPTPLKVTPLAAYLSSPGHREPPAVDARRQA